MDLKKAIFYAHGGSANHGCEAIVRSCILILKDKHKEFIVFSNKVEEDKHYHLDNIATIKNPFSETSKNIFRNFFFLIKMKILKNDYYYFKNKYRELHKKTEDAKVAYSVGGDNYCYKGYDDDLRAINEKLHAQNIKIILWGCSIEPNVLTNTLICDLSKYSKIVARESITYNALLEKGLVQTELVPDPAFYLERKDLPLPPFFKVNNTVGINISPLILKHEKEEGLVMKNVRKLIDFILENTDMNIALIPHVVWDHNDDRIPLNKIFEEYKNTKRIVLIDDHNAMEQKGFIARCRFLIAARTHASIAAYSQNIPTLVLGYSVKALGIAKDLFGTEEKYVLPVQNISNENNLIDSFRWIIDNEENILERYRSFLPVYINEGEKKIKKILSEI